MGKETGMGIIVRDIVHQRWNSDMESVEYGINDMMDLKEGGLELTWYYNCNNVLQQAHPIHMLLTHFEKHSWGIVNGTEMYSILVLPM